MKIGDVVRKEDELFVVTEVENGEIVCLENIDNFICNNAIVVDLRGEHKTIRDIIEERKRLFLLNKTIYE